MENYTNLVATYGSSSEHVYYNEMYNMYCCHFRVKMRPATYEEMVKFAQWHGLKKKTPTKKELVDHFLNSNIIF